MTELLENANERETKKRIKNMSKKEQEWVAEALDLDVLVSAAAIRSIRTDQQNRRMKQFVNEMCR